jgi:hypothetical protein
VQQPLWAPPALGAAVVTGVAAALISGYEIVDCLQYRSGRGECSAVIQENALPLVAGIAAVIGPLGGLFTYNHQLESPVAGRRRDARGRFLPQDPGHE